MAINWDLYSKKLKVSGGSFRDRQIGYMKDAYEKDFDDSPSYRDAYFNDEEDIIGIQVLDTKDGNVKNINVLSEHDLKVGDTLRFDGDIWLCLLVSDNQINRSGVVYKCTHTLSLYQSGILYEVPIAVESGVRLYQLGLDEGKYFSTPETTVVIRMPNNETTSLIKRGQVYKIGKENFEVTDINDIIESGILILKMKWTAEEPEIPEDPTPTQPIEIVGADSIEFGQSKTYTVDYPEVITFTLEGTLATITEQSNNQCTVKAGKTYGNITLVAKSGDIEGTKDILIKNWF